MSPVSYQQEINKIKENCSNHKVQLQASFDSLDKRISSLERHFEEGGIIVNMFNTVQEIDRRLFKCNGQKPLVLEISEIKTSLDNHLQKHTTNRMTRGKIFLFVMALIITNTLGVYLSHLTFKTLNINNTEQVGK
jgi:hypothetical protein